MKKVLVTGGCGYLGARFCLYLANNGYAVTSLCHSKAPEDKNWLAKMESVIIGDVTDEKFLYVLAQNEFDIIVHLVSLDQKQSNTNPILATTVNITPVWSLLDLFHKKGLKKFIYLSTSQVYGNLLDEHVNEDQNPSAQNYYALTHQVGEVICEYYNRNSKVDCSIVRLSNSYGAPIFIKNNCWGLVINELCKMAYTQKKIILQSDGSPLRDFIHGNDVCLGIKAIIETSEKHLIYNLNSGVTLSIMDIAKKIKIIFAKRYDKQIEIDTIKTNSNIKPVKYKLDNNLIHSIGFEQQWNLERGINDLFDFLEKNNE
jgi:UDP-glucose 4-epimerase